MKIAAICFAFIFIQCISIINGDTDDIPISLDELFAVKNSLNFCGKVVLITGSSSGIGSAAARLFSFLGANVVVTGRNETRIRQVARECKRLSPEHLKPLELPLDLTIPGNVAKLVNATITAYNKIDVVISNAGIGSFATLQDPAYNDVLEASRAINENAGIELIRLASSYIQSTNGSIIITTSLFARNPIISSSAYSMGKNALIAFANAIVHDLGPNVRVNLISPTVVDGTRIFRLLDPSVRPTLIANTSKMSSLKRAGIPMDIAKTMVYLASSTLSGFINAKELQLDGGLYIPLL